MSKNLVLPSPIRLLGDAQTPFSRVTSFLFPLPTQLLAELRTHRLLKYSFTEDTELEHTFDFSVNANSDRAIPIKTKIESVKNNPYIPIMTGSNKGMLGNEMLSDSEYNDLTLGYCNALESAIKHAEYLMSIGGSKQLVNRLLMPFSWSFVVVTGDNIAWQHFFNLRTKEDVEPNFRFIAKQLYDIYLSVKPKSLNIGEWYITFREEIKHLEQKYMKQLDIPEKLIVSGSCNARISFHVERDELLPKHKERFFKCVDSNHISITEHSGRVPSFKDLSNPLFKSNVNGLILTRKLIETNTINFERDLL